MRAYGMGLVSPEAYMFDIVVCASGDKSLIKDLIRTILTTVNVLVANVQGDNIS